MLSLLSGTGVASADPETLATAVAAAEAPPTPATPPWAFIFMEGRMLPERTKFGRYERLMLCMPLMLCRTLRRLRDCRNDLLMLCIRDR